MQRTAPTIIVIAATLTAAAAIWLWALRPLGFASYLSSTGATDADIIRRYWPHRLVQPEWISPAKGTGERLTNWHLAETAARLSVVGLIWIVTIAYIYRVTKRTNLTADRE